MAEKDFFFKFYAGEFLLDDKVDILPDPAQLLLVKMWCLCCLNGYAPADHLLLAKRVKMDANAVQMHMQSVMHFFRKAGDDKLVSPRMEAEMEKAGRISRVRSLAAKVKHDKDRAQKDGDVESANADANAGAKVVQLESELKKENTPLPPASGGTGKAKGKGGGKGHRSRKDVLADLEADGIPAEIVKGGMEILAFWHRKDPDGREIRSEADLLIPRLDAIVKRQPLFAIDVLIEAGRSYCEAKRQRYKAAQYFFSLQPEPDSEKPPFYEWAKAVLAKRQIATQAKAQEPTPLAPIPDPQPAAV